MNRQFLRIATVVAALVGLLLLVGALAVHLALFGITRDIELRDNLALFGILTVSVSSLLGSWTRPSETRQ